MADPVREALERIDEAVHQLHLAECGLRDLHPAAAEQLRQIGEELDEVRELLRR